MSFFFDYEEFKKYADDISSLASTANNATKDFLMEVANETVDMIKRDTPVDTGLLKQNWVATDYVHYQDLYSIDIFNPIGYASYVEDGWSSTKKGIESRFVPGYWSGGKFIYDPNSKEGMLLKHKEYKGKHMMRINVTKTQYRLNARYKRFINDFIQRNGKGLGDLEE